MNKNIISKITSVTLLGAMIAYTTPVFAFTKEETVYSKLDSTGNNYKTIVSTHLSNSENSDLIEDMTDLLNIKNTKGEETYTQEGNKLIWDANKNDIYYEGESKKDLPIECNIKYEVDGKEIEAKELAGKSGKIKINIEYTNKEERIVNINGKNVKMYVPFVVVSGAIIKNENAKNIEISSGKVIDDGSKTTIIGIAMPGLQESLGISKTEIDIPNKIEITMDATNFEMSNLATFVTPKIIEENDLSILDKMNEIYNKVQTLQDSINKIESGANTLADGTTSLLDGSTQLRTGTNSAYNGANTISSEVNKSINTLTSDKSDAIDANTLAGIEAQAANGSILNETQKQMIIAAADQGIDAEASTIKAQFVENAKQIAEATALATAESVAKSTAKQTAMSTAQSLNPSLTADQLEAIGNNAAANTVLTETQKSQIKAQADHGIEAKRATIEQQGITSAKQIAEKTAISSAQAGATTAAKATATKVASEVGNKVKTEATKKITSQMKTLSNGLNQLTNGLSTLNNGAQALESGASKLDDGAKTLATGIKTYNEEGIKKICNYINGDLKDKIDRVKKLKELSEEYNNFTMLNNQDKGNVKFIMIMDSIKKQEDSKQDVITENKYEND